MRIQMDENSATLTAFGSLTHIIPAKVSGKVSGKSWIAKLRAVFALLVR